LRCQDLHTPVFPRLRPSGGAPDRRGPAVPIWPTPNARLRAWSRPGRPTVRSPRNSTWGCAPPRRTCQPAIANSASAPPTNLSAPGPGGDESRRYSRCAKDRRRQLAGAEPL